MSFDSLQMIIPKAVSPPPPTTPNLIFPNYLPVGRVSLLELPWLEIIGDKGKTGTCGKTSLF